VSSQDGKELKTAQYEKVEPLFIDWVQQKQVLVSQFVVELQNGR
jgi:hypothetical protein